MNGYLSINKWPLRYQNARLKVRGNFFYTDSNSFSGVSCLDLSHHDANGNYCYIADSFIDVAVEVDNWTGSPQTGWQTITWLRAGHRALARAQGGRARTRVDVRLACPFRVARASRERR